MTLNEAQRIFNWFYGILVHGTGTFGISVINEWSLRKYWFGGDVGWYVIPVSTVAIGAAATQGITSLPRHKNSKVAKIIHEKLIKFECFLEIRGMSMIALINFISRNSTEFPLNERAIITIAEIIASSFALWRSIKCQEHFGFRKLEILSDRTARKPMENIAIELQGFSVADKSKSQFSINDFREFITERCPMWDGDFKSDQIDIHRYLEEYICECMRKSPRYFWQIMRDSIAYGAELACNVSFFMYILTGFSDAFDIGLFSLIPAVTIFLMAWYVGYNIEQANSLLLEMSTSNLLTNPELQEDVHELLVKFYQKSMRGVGIFAQYAKAIKNSLLGTISVMLMLVAPSVNDKTDDKQVSDWWIIPAAVLGAFFGWYSVRNVKQGQLEMAERAGTGHLLLGKGQSCIEEVRDNQPETENPTVISIEAYKEKPNKDTKQLFPTDDLAKGKEKIEEASVQCDNESDRSSDSSASNSPPQSLPVGNVMIRIEEAARSKSADYAAASSSKPPARYSSRFFDRGHQIAAELTERLLPPEECAKPANSF